MAVGQGGQKERSLINDDSMRSRYRPKSTVKKSYSMPQLC